VLLPPAPPGLVPVESCVEPPEQATTHAATTHKLMTARQFIAQQLPFVLLCPDYGCEW
jgi:hypothetical protein